MMTPGPCAKQTVTATILTPSGRRFVGTNHCNNAQKVCPRRDMPTGTGYELCRDICQQPAHAEVQALMNAIQAEPLMSFAESVIFIEGHTYACEACKKALFDAGIDIIAFGPPPSDSCNHCTCYGASECHARSEFREALRGLFGSPSPYRDRLLHIKPAVWLKPEHFSQEPLT